MIFPLRWTLHQFRSSRSKIGSISFPFSMVFQLQALDFKAWPPTWSMYLVSSTRQLLNFPVCCNFGRGLHLSFWWGTSPSSFHFQNINDSKRKSREKNCSEGGWGSLLFSSGQLLHSSFQIYWANPSSLSGRSERAKEDLLLLIDRIFLVRMVCPLSLRFILLFRFEIEFVGKRENSFTRFAIFLQSPLRVNSSFSIVVNISV